MIKIKIDFGFSLFLKQFVTMHSKEAVTACHKLAPKVEFTGLRDQERWAAKKFV